MDGSLADDLREGAAECAQNARGYLSGTRPPTSAWYTPDGEAALAWESAACLLALAGDLTGDELAAARSLAGLRFDGSLKQFVARAKSMAAKARKA